jgi:hypothetical protein
MGKIPRPANNSAVNSVLQLERIGRTSFHRMIHLAENYISILKKENYISIQYYQFQGSFGGKDAKCRSSNGRTEKAEIFCRIAE